MKNTAEVVVAGGGIAGCSVLYHLTKLGVKDVILLEKNELTSGSTWMAAGNVPLYSMGRTPARIITDSIEVYKKLEMETGHHVDWHSTGSLRLATNHTRMDEFNHVLGKDRTLGIQCELVGKERIKELFPLIETKGILGGLFHPNDGHVDGSGVTQAFSAGARSGGASIEQFNRLIGFKRLPGGEWLLETEKGEIRAQTVVLAPGPWAAQAAAMIGVFLPVISIEHHHLLFDEIPEVKALEKELPVLRDPDGPFYLRQESGSLLVGPYERKPHPWKPDGVEWDYAQQSLVTDLERFEDNLLEIFKRVPVLENAGLKHTVNGPITYTPDGTPLLGNLYGFNNIYILAGINFGITLAGGFGRALANWIIEGDPGMDLSMYDPLRFGQWANHNYTIKKATEAYRINWRPGYPDRERKAARPLKACPSYDLQKNRGAVFGVRYGWERPNWFAPKNVNAADELSFGRRTNYFPHVAAECLAARDKTSVYEMSALAKYEVKGRDAATFLERLTTNHLPKRKGGICYTLMLRNGGTFQGDYVIVRIGKNAFYVLGAAAGELSSMQWMENHRLKGEEVTIENVTSRHGILTVFGPNSRDLLARLTRSDLSNTAFPYFTAQNIGIAYCQVRALRINYVGELGWELHHPIEYQRGLYQAIIEAGQDFGLADCGMRAVNSMRLEKGYLGTAELTCEDNPMEAGLASFVRLDKSEFVGQKSLIKLSKAASPTKKNACLKIEEGEAEAFGDEPVFSGDELVGRVTSGGYGHRIGASLALAYLRPDFAHPGTIVGVDILGARRGAVVVGSPAYDPQNLRIRA